MGGRLLMLQVCLCDDDKKIANRFTPLIYLFLKNHPVQITHLESGESFLFHFKENPNFVDIILMDIDMGGINGIEVMKEMRRLGCRSELIYLTAMRDYVFDSFDTLPLHFILKTNLDINKFQSILLDAAGRALQKQSNMIVVGNSRNSTKVDKKQLLFLESSNRQILFHMLGSIPLAYSGTLLQAMELTGTDNFTQIHKSYVVNMNNIRQIKTASVMLIDGTELPLGRKFVAGARKSFSDFLSKNTLEV